MFSRKRVKDPADTMLSRGDIVTESELKAENELQMGTFLHHTANAREMVIEGDWGVTRPIGRQIFPSVQGGDGFYYALLEKIV